MDWSDWVDLLTIATALAGGAMIVAGTAGIVYYGSGCWRAARELRRTGSKRP